MAISRQNKRSTSRRSDGFPGDFIGALPVNSFIQPAGRPISTSKLEAGFVGLILAAILQAVGSFASSAGMLMTSRRCGSMPPSQMVAVQTYYLLNRFDRAQRGWRQADTRKRLLWATARRANFIGHQIPRLQWLAGGSPQVRTDTLQRCRHATAAIDAMQWRLIEARSRATSTHYAPS